MWPALYKHTHTDIHTHTHSNCQKLFLFFLFFLVVWHSLPLGSVFIQRPLATACCQLYLYSILNQYTEQRFRYTSLAIEHATNFARKCNKNTFGPMPQHAPPLRVSGVCVCVCVKHTSSKWPRSVRLILQCKAHTVLYIHVYICIYI